MSVSIENMEKFTAASGENLVDRIRQIIATVTRYPIEILEENADLEHDLGIDSVKLGEILITVRQQFSLSEEIEVPMENFRTISTAATIIESLLPSSTKPKLAVAPINEDVNEKSNTPSEKTIDISTIQEQLVSIIAEVTRYPVELLEVDVSLEHDLGIDSVKLGEILLKVRQDMGLSDDFIVPPEQFTSIREASKVLHAEISSTQISNRNTDEVQIDDTRNADTTIDQPRVEVSYESKESGIPELNTLFSANENKPFLNKISLVTGSGRGIGKTLATSLANLGATVIVNAFHSRQDGERTAEEINDNGGRAHFVWGSVAHKDQRKALFANIDEKFGGLDHFVSNASNGLIGKFDEINDDHWYKGFQTNVVGLHQCSLAAVKLMEKRGGGKIITLSTPVSHRHVEDFACMAALKAAVESLTKTMAVEFEKYNVSVNCVSPGAVYGDLIKRFPNSQNAIQYWEDKSLGNQLVDPQEVANMVNFILSSATRRLNGSVNVIDGGITIKL